MSTLVQKARNKGVSVNIETVKNGYEVMVSVENSPVCITRFSKTGKVTKQILPKRIKKGFWGREFSVYIFKKRILKE